MEKLESPFLKAVIGTPKPIAMNAIAMNDPKILKKIGGSPNPFVVQSPMRMDSPMKPKIEMKMRTNMGGRFCMDD
ncbi:hypothetical protein N8766_02600 [bacterium]|nr:hypothetical protein [bacterium]MDA7657876.1 hypothetical protein [Verrucomicrobiota bacterium]MDB4796890.1 hypothetical protein [bacterium]